MSAKAIAGAAYQNLGKTSRGTTVITAPHAWQRYRRARTTTSRPLQLASAGPRTWRSTTP